MFLHSKFITILLAGGAAELCAARDDPPSAPTVEYVRKVLDSDAETQWRLKYRLLELGTKAFPIYEKLWRTRKPAQIKSLGSSQS